MFREKRKEFEMHSISGMGWGMSLIWLFGLAIIIVNVWLVTQNGKTYNGNEKTALDILKERLAKGELSQEEYKKMKQHIS